MYRDACFACDGDSAYIYYDTYKTNMATYTGYMDANSYSSQALEYYNKSKSDDPTPTA
jgi:hypothetical protein